MSSKITILVLFALALTFSYANSQKFLGISDEEADFLIQTKQYLETPYKLSHKDCIIEVPSHSRVEEVVISETEKEAHVTFLNQTKKVYGQCKHESYIRSRLLQNNTNHWPDHSWFGSQQNFSAQITNFTANYVVPQAPANDDNTVLYYWLGMLTKNINLSTGLVIQPVLGYQSGQFSFTSWNCCPAGYVFHSEMLYGMNPGDVLYGQMSLSESPKVYEIISQYGNQSSNLQANLNTIDNFVGNWGVIVGEYYNIVGCNQYPVGPVTFDNISVTLINNTKFTYNWTDFDQWDEYINCGGSTKVSESGDQVQLIYTEATN